MFVVKAKHVRILESLDYVTRVANQTCIDEPCCFVGPTDPIDGDIKYRS